MIRSLASKDAAFPMVMVSLNVPVAPENMPGVVDVRFAEREPAEKRNLLSWEQVHETTS